MQILFLTLLLSGSILSAECYKELCTDDVVRDQFGWKGSVYQFDTNADIVHVQLHHNGYVYPFPYKDLGKQVRCFEKFCTGDEIKNQSGHDLIIEEVYNHRMLLVHDLNVDGHHLYDFDEL